MSYGCGAPDIHLQRHDVHQRGRAMNQLDDKNQLTEQHQATLAKLRKQDGVYRLQIMKKPAP